MQYRITVVERIYTLYERQEPIWTHSLGSSKSNRGRHFLLGTKLEMRSRLHRLLIKSNKNVIVLTTMVITNIFIS